MTEAATSFLDDPSDQPAGIAQVPSVVFDNRTPFSAMQFNAIDQFDSAFHIVVVRQAYSLGERGADGLATLHPFAAPAPLIVEDVCHDADPAAGVAQESDLSPYKPRCDIIVNACAYAPGGSPATRIVTRLLVRDNAGETLMDKRLLVTGERTLDKAGIVGRAANATVRVGTAGLLGLRSWVLSKPAPFTRLPIRYQYAAGGECKIDADHPSARNVPPHARLPLSDSKGDPIAHEVAETNPLGRGYSAQWYLDATGVRSLPAPRIVYEERDFSAADFIAWLKRDTCVPAAGYGFVGRAWLPRRALTGTIEVKDSWGADEYPRLPKDFDFRYWNGAPEDQQCDHLRGGEEIELHNLCSSDHPSATVLPDGSTVLRVRLPEQAVFVLMANNKGELGIELLVIDTVTIDPDASRIDLVWRAYIPANGRYDAFRLMQASEPEQIARAEQLALAYRELEREREAKTDSTVAVPAP